jgi:hypothetical protein
LHFYLNTTTILLLLLLLPLLLLYYYQNCRVVRQKISFLWKWWCNSYLKHATINNSE